VRIDRALLPLMVEQRSGVIIHVTSIRILEGPPIRYVLPGTEGWRTADSWPPLATYHPLALGADGTLADDEGVSGTRQLMSSGVGLNRDHPSPVDPAPSLTWTSQTLEHDLDIVGDIELQLDAISTAPDTAWIAILQDVDASGAVTEVTAGYLRASLRAVDESNSRLGAPALPCRTFDAVPVGKPVKYRIPLVANARRFRASHRIQLFIISDDQNPETPAILRFRHASVGTSSLNAISSSSRLMLPVLPESR
jgi:hypothetical protein